ncbi:MAG: ABC transporter ATP-binding protein [Bacillota bacterium]|nr:ABC transporter ATP-binding protein [Bacillota bacterium]
MDAVLQFDNVTFGYSNGGKRVDILKNVNANFEKGVFYSIIGPSGSGKTTTLALAGALDVPQNGKVLFDGQDIRKIGLTKHRKENVVMIFQNYNLINYMTALENVTMAMELSGSFKGQRKQQAIKLLKDLGLTDDEIKRNVMKMSGGQQQRVAIARALAGDAEVILADEPTGNLDVNTSREIIQIFKDLAHEYDKCVIVVSHSHEVASESDVAYKFENGGLQRVFELNN